MGLFSSSPKIKVVYKNGSRDKIVPGLLSALIDAREIVQFQRSDGWITVGLDPIRGMGGTPYRGDERRNDGTTAHLF
ncbi:MAG TPA: hypothetical protein VGA63_06770 [Geopsychrobacteraceae bacterium]|jgi:hypothetical protein